MNDNIIARVRYFEQQFLRTQDFTDEQAYHLAMRRRHNIAHHSWGIVQGLEVKLDEEGLFIQPGVAIDGYGRELILPVREPLPVGTFDDKGVDKLDVLLVYGRFGRDSAPSGYGSSGSNGNSLQYRWQERPLVYLEKPSPATISRRSPKGVPPGDLDFSPSRTPPDDPQMSWPVFLGQIQREQLDPGQPNVYTYTINLDNRPIAGLKGEAVLAPSGRARVQIGAESADDLRRFAVFIPENASDTKLPPPSLEISKNGEIGIRGDTKLHGDLLVKGHAITLEVGEPRSPNSPPWRIYHHREENEILVEPDSDQQSDNGASNQPTPQPNQTASETGNQTGDKTDSQMATEKIVDHQLRIEMPAGAYGRNQVVI